ncbi:hypothetical protein JCM5296_001870 [Sporobolomyces johnsonii]
MKVITQLRQLITASLDAFEAELTAHCLPDLDFEPVAHPLDNPDYLTPPRLFEARRAALSGLSMLTTLIKPAYQTAAVEGPCGSALVAAYAVAIEFDIATLLADPSVDTKAGVSAALLGKKCGVDSAKLARMLRILTSEGVFTELSETSVPFVRAAVSAIHPFLRAVGFNIAFDCDAEFFPWVTVAGLLNDYPYEKLPEGTHLVDVAGGQGSMSFPIIAKHKQLTLTIQDQEHVLPAAQANWDKHWTHEVASDRFSLQAHDFLKPNPIRGDNVVYMMRWVTHDWPDAVCVEILKNLRSGMSPKSKLLIMEIVITPPVPSTVSIEDYLDALSSVDNDAPYSPLVLPAPLPVNGVSVARTEVMLDANMMSLFNSQERTTEQLQRILDAADLELIKVHHTRGMLHISEVVVKGASGTPSESNGDAAAPIAECIAANGAGVNGDVTINGVADGSVIA